LTSASAKDSGEGVLQTTLEATSLGYMSLRASGNVIPQRCDRYNTALRGITRGITAPQRWTTLLPSVYPLGMFEVCIPRLDARLRRRNSLAICPSDDLELFRSGCSVAEPSSGMITLANEVSVSKSQCQHPHRGRFGSWGEAYTSSPTPKTTCDSMINTNASSRKWNWSLLPFR
jgi:hypothetical protein